MKNLDPFRITSNNDQQPANEPEPSRFSRFVRFCRRAAWWIAAKDPDTVETQCTPGTQMKFTSIGIHVGLIIPALAFVGMYQFLKPLELGVLGYFGSAVWAAIVPMIERSALLAQVGASGASKWATAGVRFAGAAIVGLLISKAIIVMFFGASIERAIRERVDTRVAQMEKKARTENTARKEELLAESKKLQDRLDSYKATRDEADRLRHAEADGEMGHEKGEGKHHARRKEAWERVAAEYESQKLLIEPKIQQNDTEIAGLEDNVKTRARVTQEAEEQSRDFLSKQEALFSVIWASPIVGGGTYMLLFLGLTIFDTLPLLQKVFGKRDEYDAIVEDGEESVIAGIRLSNRASLDSVELEQTIWRRVVNYIRDGRPKLRDEEKRLGQRVYAAITSSLLERLFGNGRTTDARTVRIVFAVQGHPQVELAVQLPKAAGEVATLMDFNEDLDRIADQLPQNGHGRQQFLRAETSLGSEIYVNEPLIGQLESDRRVVLVYGHTLDYGATV